MITLSFNSKQQRKWTIEEAKEALKAASQVIQQKMDFNNPSHVTNAGLCKLSSTFLALFGYPRLTTFFITARCCICAMKLRLAMLHLLSMLVLFVQILCSNIRLLFRMLSGILLSSLWWCLLRIHARYMPKEDLNPLNFSHYPINDFCFPHKKRYSRTGRWASFTRKSKAKT